MPVAATGQKTTRQNQTTGKIRQSGRAIMNRTESRYNCGIGRKLCQEQQTNRAFCIQ